MTTKNQKPDEKENSDENAREKKNNGTGDDK